MFGLTFREKIINIIIQTYTENANTYKFLLTRKLHQTNIIPTAEELMLICENAINEYDALMFGKISDIVLSINSSVSTRFKLACESPQICGISENNSDILCSPAVLCYAMIYWAYYNKKYSLSNKHNYKDAHNIVDAINKITVPIQDEFSHEVSTRLLAKIKNEQN